MSNQVLASGKNDPRSKGAWEPLVDMDVIDEGNMEDSDNWLFSLRYNIISPSGSINDVYR